MKFDDLEYTIENGMVKQRLNSGHAWGTPPNLNQRSAATMMDVVGGALIVYCQDGTKYRKRHGCGWDKM